MVQKTFKHVREYFQEEKCDVEGKQQMPEQEVDEQHEGDTEDDGTFSLDETLSPPWSSDSGDATDIYSEYSRSMYSLTSEEYRNWPIPLPCFPPSTGRDEDGFLEVEEYSCHHPDAMKSTFHHTLTVLSSKEEFNIRYKEEKRLGEGGQGVVYAGERRSDSKPVAIKHVKEKHMEFVRVKCQGRVFTEISEVFLMEQAAGRLCDGRFPNRGVIGLIETFDLGTEVIIVMERLSDSLDMFDYFTEVKSIPEDQAKIILKQIVNTAFLMHKNGVFHRDLKLQNLLVQRNQGNPAIRLIDFGCADLVEREPFSDFYGTRQHAPPECLRRELYKAESSTVFQIGTILHTVCTCRIFVTEEYLKTGHEVLPCVSEQCNDFLSRCLALDPNQRPTLEDLMLHPWLQ